MSLYLANYDETDEANDDTEDGDTVDEAESIRNVEVDQNDYERAMGYIRDHDPDLHRAAEEYLTRVLSNWPLNSEPMAGIRNLMARVGVCAHGQISVSPEQHTIDLDIMNRLREDDGRLESFGQKYFESLLHRNHSPEADEIKVILASIMKRLQEKIYYARMVKQSIIMYLHQSTTLKVTFQQVGQESCKMFEQIFMARPLGLLESPPDSDRFRLIAYVSHLLNEGGFRRKKGSDRLYSEVTYREGNHTVGTYSYHPGITIEDFIYQSIRMETRADLYEVIMTSANVTEACRFILRGSSARFPFINTDNHKYSFLDGVYDIETDTFAFYDEIPHVFPELVNDNVVTYKFIPQVFATCYWREKSTSRKRRRTDRGFEESKGSDEDDDDDDDGSEDSYLSEDEDVVTLERDGRIYEKIPYREIHNPVFEKIFYDQKWTLQTVLLKYATLGRTLWPTKTHDRCQYVTVDIGQGGTGKSTAVMVWQEFFHEYPDVFAFGADQEQSFGRDKLVDARIWIAPDMRGDTNGLTVQFFLSLVSGESVVLPVKHGSPINVKEIRVPGLIVTNELPPSYMKDKRGAVYRRILPFPYKESISHRDPMLTERIKPELPGILRKARCAYRDDDVHPREKDIICIPLPEEIEHERRLIERSCNPILDFLMDPTRVYLPTDPLEAQEIVCDKNMFFDEFIDFCKTKRQMPRPPAIEENLYMPTFARFNITVEHETTGDEARVSIRGCKAFATLSVGGEGF